MEKIFFYDLETTGVNYWENAIHQLAGIIVIDDEVKEKFNFKMAPWPGAKIEQSALDVAGVTLEQILSYPGHWETYKALQRMLGKYVNKFVKTDKFHLAGFNNAQFDNQFFRELFNQCGDKYFGSWFWADSWDCMTLASYRLRAERHQMENFQLRTVARKLGIPVDETKLHDADYDIFLTREIFRKCTEEPVKEIRPMVGSPLGI